MVSISLLLVAIRSIICVHGCSLDRAPVAGDQVKRKNANRAIKKLKRQRGPFFFSFFRVLNNFDSDGEAPRGPESANDRAC